MSPNSSTTSLMTMLNRLTARSKTMIIGPTMIPRMTAPDMTTAFPAFLANSFSEARLAAHFARRASRLAFFTSSLLIFSTSMVVFAWPVRSPTASACGVQLEAGFSFSLSTPLDLLIRDLSFSSFWSILEEVFFIELVIRDDFDELLVVETVRFMVGSCNGFTASVTCDMAEEVEVVDPDRCMMVVVVERSSSAEVMLVSVYDELCTTGEICMSGCLP